MKFIFFSLLSILLFFSCGDDSLDKYKSASEYGHFAPPDAFEEDSLFAYYGSENKWNRRMFSERAANNQYKRSGQRLLLFVIDGQLDEAVKECKNRLETYPDDLEALFVLTLAYCELDDVNNAWNTVQNALKKGLPIERFIAGPRDLLKPLYNLKEYREYVKGKDIQIIHGPMIGAKTESGIKLWLRTADEFEVIMEIFDDSKAKKSLTKLSKYSRADNDYTVKFNVNGLNAGREYYYDIRIDGKLNISKQKFTTFQKKENLNSFKIIFGGGAGYIPSHSNMWNVIEANNPDALLLLGDNVYIDLPQMPGNFHHYTYYRRQSEKNFRNLVAKVPVYTIWDDHDSGTDDVWLGPYLDKPNWKMPMLNHYKRQWINPGYGQENNPGCYYDFSIGNVDFIMLDCRFYRTNPFQKETTMIGPVQKKWLKEKLKNSKGIFKILVSSVPWSQEVKPGSHDPWDGFPEEREEIFSFIEENKIEGVVLVAADRHRSDAWKTIRSNGYDLYEFQSSKLTNVHTHKIMPGSLFGYNEKCSFGELKFNLKLEDPELTYTITNIDNEKIDSITIKHSQLKY